MAVERSTRPAAMTRLPLVASVAMLWLACGGTESPQEDGGPEGAPRPSTLPAIMTAGSDDYCAIPEHRVEVLARRPSADEPPIDDVNWFARPVPHDGDEWIIAFASHDQNYLYDLTAGVRVRIPDRSDAVATPDGRYMTVPSYYTPDSTIRFYPVEPMLDALRSGEDADDLEPAYVHDHPSMSRVYYQSTARVSEEVVGDEIETTYRLMFSGTNDRSGFRITDYVFAHERASRRLVDVTPSEPMAICPAVQNDLNTPFISKDGRYVVAYTSESPDNAYSPGASLKVFEIVSTDPGGGSTTCEPVLDFGFAAGKADFSFDGSMVAFHLSQGAYLTPFVNGGLPESTITDVMVARLERDADGRIVGHSGLQRLSTSLTAGVGSYFPAFFPDGNLFYLSNRVPRESETPKRFELRVVDPGSLGWRTPTLDSEENRVLWSELGRLWQEACTPGLPSEPEDLFPLDGHEIPFQAMSLTVPQCTALVEDARGGSETTARDRDALLELCSDFGS